MLSKKTAQKKISEVREKNFDDDMILTEEESIHFKDEINKQLSESKIIDIGKAVRNARYLAKLDKSIQQEKEGKLVKFTDEEWEKFVSGQELY